MANITHFLWSNRQHGRDGRATSRAFSFSGLCALCVFAVAFLSVARAADAPVVYSNDFEKLPEGEPPKEFVVLNGTFAIKSVDGNKVLEMPGDPVDNYGVLFGPEGLTDAAVRARVYATATGKRTPEFGVGVGDANGYKLWVVPATRELQILLKGDDVAATVPFAWKSGTWTDLCLQVKSAGGGKTVVQGKAWEHGTAEPKDWSVHFDDAAPAPKGRASVSGSNYSSTPIRFDDLQITKPVD